MSWLVESLAAMSPGSREAADAVRLRAADILRPAGGIDGQDGNALALQQIKLLFQSRRR